MAAKEQQTTQFDRLANCIKSVMQIQDTMSLADRTNSEFIFSIVVDRIKYVVGKGGVNTMFYSVGKGDRKICHPDDMLRIIRSWNTQEFSSYVIYNTKRKKRVSGPYGTEEQALKVYPKANNVILGKGDKNIRLYTASKSLTGKYVWIKRRTG